MATYNLTLPLTKEDRQKLHAGDICYLSGILYTARDAAHKRLCSAMEANEVLPIDLTKTTIYYTGPTPTPLNQISGAIGPTSSYRMDPYAITLMRHGQRVTIGKGERSESFKEALKQTSSIYFTAVGGLGALLSKQIIKSEVIAYPDLGAEAIHRLEVLDFPVLVGYDTYGNSIFRSEQK